MSIIKKAARLVLFLQALNNFVVGSWTIYNPTGFAQAFDFKHANQKAIQSIGFGALGVGAYGAAGAYANLGGFYVITTGLRLLFAAIMLNQWGLEGNGAVLVYECFVSVAAAVAAST